MILTGHDVDLIDTRERWEELTSLFADCVGGRGGVALISGPVGFGKTELLRPSRSSPRPPARWC